MKTDELLEYINLEPRDWQEVPNEKLSEVAGRKAK
jgi:hypothetical protein